MTFACFHMVGTSPDLKERLKRHVNEGVISFATVLRSLAEMSSGPPAFGQGLKDNLALHSRLK